jgi:hypothetical protein
LNPAPRAAARPFVRYGVFGEWFANPFGDQIVNAFGDDPSPIFE